METNETVGINIYDIKHLVEIVDYSVYYFSLLVFITLLILITTSIWLWIKYKKKHKQKKEILKFLNSINFEEIKTKKQTKNLSYQLSDYLTFFITKDTKNEKQIKLNENTTNLISKLQNYKYKKLITSFDEQIQNDIKQTISDING